MPFDNNNYVAPEGSGFVAVVNGVKTSYPTQAAAEQAYNSGTGQSNTPSGAGITYSTPNGPMTIEQIRAKMVEASGDPSYNTRDAASVLAAYRNVASGRNADGSAVKGTSTGAFTTGGTAMVDNNARSNQEDHQLKVDEFTWKKLTDAQKLALEALGYQVDLSSQPKDYFKFNEFTSGGRNIFEQLNGSVPRAAFSAPTGAIEPNSFANALAQLGINFGGAGGTVDQNAALDAIWKNRPDLASFYRANGWQVDTPEQQRAAVQNWLGMTDDADVTAAGRNAATYASGKGWVSGTATPAATTAVTSTATTPAATPTAGATTSGGDVGATGGAYGAGAPPPSSSPTAQGVTAGATSLGGSVTLSGQTYNVPLPYQVRPDVWDAMGPVGQQLALGAVAKAGWDPTEYQYQLNQSRPQGTAPKSTRTLFSEPTGIY